MKEFFAAQRLAKQDLAGETVQKDLNEDDQKVMQEILKRANTRRRRIPAVKNLSIKQSGVLLRSDFRAFIEGRFHELNHSAGFKYN
jgi:hypothetical protein